ncbi:dihydrolipoyllysine-residue acetyltransferase [Proteobacteria bacterium 005FR1]|nr:dihydrolipoyllysine-residue acetyltransferase [Proteobacteria bacterium 005FR1]
MSKQTVKVPDIGTDQAAEVAEVLVSEGDSVEVEQSIIVLETDKASVEVPSSHAGKVISVLVKEGDQLKTGAAIMEVQTEAEDEAADEEVPVPAEQGEPSAGAKEPTADYEGPTAAPRDEDTREESERKESKRPEAQPTEEAKEINVPVPDIGDAGDVEVIEISVSVDDEVEEGDTLLVLESDKASMEIPSPASGKVTKLLVGEGDKVKQGQQIAVLQSAGGKAAGKAPEEKPEAKRTERPVSPPEQRPTTTPVQQTRSATQAPAQLPPAVEAGDGSIYAGPAVRKLARQLGVDLSKVKPSGPRNRYTKEDVRSYVKDVIARGGTGAGIPQVPAVDFAKFGEIKRVKMSKIKRSTAANMHRAWLNVPHVTQFDDADITALESFRKEKKAEAEKRGVKLTPLPFILKACALTLKAEPSFNVSLDPDGEHMIEKQYIHIGMAVDAPGGLMVPVIRDVDQKDIWQLAEETVALATKARDGKLLPKDMQGGCFSISSLGAIGGQGFTPVVNTPEVGILGVSKAAIKPFWDGEAFVPHTFLPLSLSYDHRAVNGADAGRFLTHLVGLLSDYREWVDLG